MGTAIQVSVEHVTELARWIWPMETGSVCSQIFRLDWVQILLSKSCFYRDRKPLFLRSFLPVLAFSGVVSRLVARASLVLWKLQLKWAFDQVLVFPDIRHTTVLTTVIELPLYVRLISKYSVDVADGWEVDIILIPGEFVELALLVSMHSIKELSLGNPTFAAD